MRYEIKNEFISKELEAEISAAIRERRSVEQLLLEKSFVGTEETLEELAYILVKYMGVNMALEFIFTANLGDWENYRNILNDLWDRISGLQNFTPQNKLVLGQFLYQRKEVDMGTKYISKAAANVNDIKTAIAIAELVNREVGSKKWVKEILLEAKAIAINADDYAKVAKSFVELINDKDESRKAIEKSVKNSHTFPEFCDAAGAILKSFGDKKWAEEVFAMGAGKKDPSSMLDMIAEEEYQKTLSYTK